jgi:hypothetical protein
MRTCMVSSGRSPARGWVRGFLVRWASYLAGGCVVLAGAAWAGPGAHGPNGEHLGESPAAVKGSPRASQPRLEAQSERYELVGTLSDGELSLMIDVFSSNAPVLGAKVEVEAHGLKATAVFHPDQGDYAVTDAALLQRLAAPGEHAVLITIAPRAGGPEIEADLLAGVLSPPEIASPLAEHEHGHSWAARGGVGLGLLALAAALFVWLRGRGGWGRKHGAARADGARDEPRQDGSEIGPQGAPKAEPEAAPKAAQKDAEQGGQA